MVFLACQAHEDGTGRLKFEENKGQFPGQVHYRVRLPDSWLFLEDQCLVFLLRNPDEWKAIHDHHHGALEKPDTLYYHAFKVHFKGSQKPTAILAQNPHEDYLNYFIGNDSTKWYSGVKQYGRIVYENIYPGIDFHIYSNDYYLKYDFVVHPGADPSVIQMEYEGTDGIKHGFENLVIETSVQDVVDLDPVSWNVLEGQKEFVETSYAIAGHETENPVVSFDLGPYDPQLPLVIDPTLVFSTYTGSTSDNWGSTATYDDAGNMYTGGIVITTLPGTNGYPTTTGAFQTTFQGGPGGGAGGFGTDIVISKFNTSGTSLLYSTYLGGSSNEIPHSLVVNGNNELYVLGTTSSSDYPTANAYDNSFNGGTGIAGANNTNQVPYPNGSDIVVTKFNLGGTALLGSTFIGGTGNDGLNKIPQFVYNYSDEFRGEIIVDSNDNCFIATTTASADFPVVNGFQNTYGGGTGDGVVCKFNSNLSSMLWSTYLGGTSGDAAYSLQFDPLSTSVFVCGGTMSSDFPTTPLALHPNALGNEDGYLVKISGTGQVLQAGTYLGTSSFDLGYFVQCDLAGNVFAFGVSEGSYPITPATVYNNPNSGQYIHKLDNNLQSTVFSTVFGTGSGSVDISPTAFLVNQCDHIFISGWGGAATTGNPVAINTTSTTTGLPITANAYQSTTEGNDFYFAVFEANATGLLFGTFFGGNSGSGEHADGGTSRFDKQGIIYQAVCADCGGSNFPTSPANVYAPVSGTHNTANPQFSRCNLAAIKYDLVTLIAEAGVDGPPQICIKDSLHYVNESFGGSQFFWDFGDGNTSNAFEPVHKYAQPGTYQTMLVIYDSVSCIASDTDYISIEVIPGAEAQVIQPPNVCPGDSVQLQASGGTSYTWSPTTGLSNPLIANPTASITEDHIYTVNVTDSCGSDTAKIHLSLHDDNTGVMDDTTICEGMVVQMDAYGGTGYKWSPGIFLSNTNTRRPLCSADTTTIYNVAITDANHCTYNHEVTVYVDGLLPTIYAKGDTTACPGDRVTLGAEGAFIYEWFPKTFINNPYVPNPSVYPQETTMYIASTSNSCGTVYDSVLVTIVPLDFEAMADTTVCQGDTVELRATGAVRYFWSGPGFSGGNQNQYPVVRPEGEAQFRVIGKNSIGCADTAFVNIHVFPYAELDILTNPDTITGLDSVALEVYTPNRFFWDPHTDIGCDTCKQVRVYPLYETTYIANAVDTNRCPVRDSITLKAISALYVPNTFTPDQDNINETFRAYGHNILEFEMIIFNRWGEEIFHSSHIETGWNGRKNNTGKESPIGTYPYQIRYTVLPGQEQVQTGAVNLVR